MYLAEIMGELSQANENREDILTSNVFSFFKYADRKLFLYRFARSLELEISEEDALGAEFLFWPSLDGTTEPDLVIIVGDYYLLVEAKYLSKISQKQLVKEVEWGRYEAKNLGKKFRLMAVTADYRYPAEEARNLSEEVLSALKWANWQQIALLIYRILEGGAPLAPETKEFAEDLYSLLQKKNLRSYAGITVLCESAKLAHQDGCVFFEASTAGYRGSFLGFSTALSLGKRILPFPKRIFFGHSGLLFSELRGVSDFLEKHNGHLFLRGKERRVFFSELSRAAHSIRGHPSSIFYRG